MPEQQLVEIAKALAANASVLIMDEPTSSLGQQDTRELLRIVREVRARGTGILYISHRLEELFEIADRVTVLRDGSNAGSLGPGNISSGRGDFQCGSCRSWEVKSFSARQ
jgi:ABC-type sugar transport system ATPase subunit